MKFEIRASTPAGPPMPNKHETWNALALLVALGLPFALAGLWGLAQARGRWVAHDTTGALFQAVVGLAFTVVGIGLIAGSLWARGRVAREAALAFAYPDEPWKWREDWAAGHVLDRRGNSRLVLDTVPVPVGRTLSGMVHTRLAQVPADGFELVLTALRTTRTGSDVTRSIVWQGEARVAGQPYGDTEGVFAGAPVAFRIPVEAPGTDHDELEWKLVVRARDYEAMFDLPVYRTEESGSPETARDATHLRAV